MTETVKSQERSCIRLEAHRYETSRDYKSLWELLQKTPVVCVADWSSRFERDIVMRDICATIWHAGTATIGCRGVCYVWAESFEQFEQQCQKANVDAILPPPRWVLSGLDATGHDDGALAVTVDGHEELQEREFQDWTSALAEIEQLREANATLRAEHAKLLEDVAWIPRTRDGVLVKPGMRVYLDWADKTAKVLSVGNGEFRILYSKVEEGWGISEVEMSCHEAWSSRQAYEASIGMV